MGHLGIIRIQDFLPNTLTRKFQQDESNANCCSKAQYGWALDFPCQCCIGVQNASFMINLLKLQIKLGSVKLKISVLNHNIT